MKLMDMSNPKLPETAAMPSPVSSGYDKYPYGLRICLNNDQLEKLGIKDLPKVGTTMVIEAVGEVCENHQSDSLNGKPYRSMYIQITEMGAAVKKTRESKMYGDKE